MTLQVACLVCLTPYDLGQHQESCPVCGGRTYQHETESGLLFMQTQPPKSSERAKTATNLREYAKALRQDDINQFYTVVVAAEMEKAAVMLEGGRF